MLVFILLLDWTYSVKQKTLRLSGRQHADYIISLFIKNIMNIDLGILQWMSLIKGCNNFCINKLNYAHF